MRYFCFLIPLFFASCIDDSDVSYIYYRNDLDVKVCYWSMYLEPEELADTSLWKESPFISNFKLKEKYRNVIEPHSTMKALTGSDTFYQFEVGRTRRYFFFDYDSVIALPWEIIRDEYMVLKRIDMNSMEDYKKCNYTITIP